MKKVLVIAGPTAVGKTSLSVELAKKYNGEIISGDSMQIYREMSIGTAKVTKEEMQEIPHYLINELSYRDEYSVKEFQKRARVYIEDIHERGKIPIICGGTGLYIKACLYDYEFPDEIHDEAFLHFLQQCSTSQLYEMLKIVDNKSCEKIHEHNRQRIIRALEIAHIGKKKSDLVDEQEHKPLYDIYIIGLTMERSHLYERINQRVDFMIQAGLRNEINDIVQCEDDWNLQSMQGIGYKEWKSYVHDEESLEDIIERIKKNSRNFAKRQYTWFHNQLPMHWFDVEKDDWKACLKEDLEKYIVSM